ncbi:MAG: hypothetical protein ABI156_04645, partial [Caldimonas sp.]
ALRPGASSYTWWRWASPVVATVGELQENWLRTQQFQGGEAGQLRALDGLASWQVYFYQGNTWSNCQSTGNVIVAPGASASAAPARVALPAGVRIVLEFAPGSGRNGMLTRDSLLGP